MFRRKPTFALIVAVLFALGAPVLAVTNPWLAEKNGLSILKADLPPCTADGPAQNRAFTVNNCTTKISCASTGTETVRLVCDGTTWRALNATATAVDLGDYAPLAGATFTGPVSINVEAASIPDQESYLQDTTNDRYSSVFQAVSDTDAVVEISTSVGGTPVSGVRCDNTGCVITAVEVPISGVYERKVTNVTVADDAAGTKPTGAIPITTDFATCTCNDATGCTMSIAEPTPTAGYGRSLTIVSIGTGNCEFADSSGVTEIGSAIVLEPTSAVTFAYLNSSWYNTSYKDNVP